MAMWPTYARLRFRPFAEQRESGVMSTEMESGPPKVVVVRSRVMVRRPVEVGFRSRVDYLAFIDWFRIEIKQGAQWFDWLDPVTRTVRRARIAKGELGDASPIRPLARDGGWRMTLTLETWQ